jgi:hypothetical protein
MRIHVKGSDFANRQAAMRGRPTVQHAAAGKLGLLRSIAPDQSRNLTTSYFKVSAERSPFKSSP